MAVDFNKLDLAVIGEEGYNVQVVDPYGEDMEGVTIRVRSEHSKTVSAFTTKRFNEYQKQQRVARGKNKEYEPDIEELRDQAAENAAIRVIGWTGIALGEDELPCNFENATALLRKHEWLRNQVIEASNELTNFRPK